MIIDIIEFAVRADADVDDFLAADAAVQAEMMTNDTGFVRRTTARNASGWLELTVWGSIEAAEAAQARGASTPERARLEGFVEPGSVRFVRYETLD